MQQMERGPEGHLDQYHRVEVTFVFHKHVFFSTKTFLNLLIHIMPIILSPITFCAEQF